MMKKLMKISEIATLLKSAASKLLNISIQILIAHIEDLNEDCVKISGSYFYTFRKVSRQRALRSSQSIVLNDLKVSELIDC